VDFRQFAGDHFRRQLTGHVHVIFDGGAEVTLGQEESDADADQGKQEADEKDDQHYFDSYGPFGNVPLLKNFHCITNYTIFARFVKKGQKNRQKTPFFFKKVLLAQSGIIWYIDSMNEPIYQRIKQLRKELALTQNEFSAIITISSGQLACIETGKRVVNNRTIKLICDSFNANDTWLRTGEGSMFTDDKDTRYKSLVALYDTLKPRYQEYIYNSINSFIKMQEEE
jgi:transcriptional regulator with XRE-family HTH domain